MVKTLLSEVTVSIEADLDGASGALVEEGHRLGDLYNDLAGLRPQVDDGVGGTRETTIHGLFFGGVLGKAFREATEVSGALAAMVSLATGLTGTVLDSVLIRLLESLSEIQKSLRDFDPAEVDEAIYRGSEEEGWKGILYQILEDLLFPVLGPAPPEYSVENDGTVSQVPREMVTDLDHTIGRIKDMRKTLRDDPSLKRLYDEFESIKTLEAMLVKDPTKNMADFWVNAITRTEGWKNLTGGA